MDRRQGSNRIHHTRRARDVGTPHRTYIARARNFKLGSVNASVNLPPRYQFSGFFSVSLGNKSFKGTPFHGVKQEDEEVKEKNEISLNYSLMF